MEINILKLEGLIIRRNGNARYSIGGDNGYTIYQSNTNTILNIQGSFNYPKWGDQTMQMDRNCEDFLFTMHCLGW